MNTGNTAEQPEDIIAREERTDHAQATRRGKRIRDLADACLSVLVARGLLASDRRNDARVAIFSILVDDIYGGAAVNIPTLRD